jgi:hypothetical protein
MYFKGLIFGTMAMLVLGAGAQIASAAPNKAENNPKIVANYSDGDHGIPGEYYLHTGSDVVMQAGGSNNFVQWFQGWSAEDGGIYEGDHTVWMVSKNGTCPTGWMFIPNASASWGSYLAAGATYCVMTNNFNY